MKIIIQSNKMEILRELCHSKIFIELAVNCNTQLSIIFSSQLIIM